MKPFFSIVVPTLNEETFLPHLLKSLTQQTYKDFEVIVSDGTSHDRTLQIVTTYKEKLPIRIIENKKRGVAHQRNTGGFAAVGQYIISTDADSRFFPYSLERIKTFIHQRKVRHMASWFCPDTYSTGDALLILLINAGIEVSIRMKRPAAYGAFMVTKRDLFGQVNGYNETLEFGEDNDLCRRIHEEQGVMMEILREPTVTYSLRRFHKQGLAKTVQISTWVSIVLLLTKRTPTKVPGYDMGGHLYTEKEEKKRLSIMESYEKTFKKFMSELLK